MSLLTHIILVATVLFILSVIVLATTIGITKKSGWCIPLFALVFVAVANVSYMEHTAIQQKPQLIANELNINADDVYYDDNIQLWLTNDASYRAGFTDIEFIETESGIKANIELESLVKIGESVIK